MSIVVEPGGWRGKELVVAAAEAQVIIVDLIFSGNDYEKAAVAFAWLLMGSFDPKRSRRSVEGWIRKLGQSNHYLAMEMFFSSFVIFLVFVVQLASV